MTGENAPAVRLFAADIGYQLSLDRTAITNGTGPAVYAAGLRTGNGLLLRDAALSRHAEEGARASTAPSACPKPTSAAGSSSTASRSPTAAALA